MFFIRPFDGLKSDKDQCEKQGSVGSTNYPSEHPQCLEREMPFCCTRALVSKSLGTCLPYSHRNNILFPG